MADGTILVVDDEPEIREFVRRYLERDGYRVVTAPDGDTALEKARAGVDLIILDLMIPGPDGLEVTRRIRASSPLPILILTARGDEVDRVAGLELGADDYLTKPFSPRELVARVKALLRRSRMPSVGSIQSGPVVVDAEARRVLVDGDPVELTPREYDLLRVLAGAPGKNFTREELLDRVWGPEYLGQTRRVDVHISNLRDKLSREGRPAPIRSIWGVGYRYEA
ncbi:MAG: response regulator transcription factor [Armatimonadetes bacterium]|nr:response regulator transcription factor [Armatimonadota bacterium]